MILKGKQGKNEEVLVRCSCIGDSLEHDLLFSYWDEPESNSQLFCCHVGLRNYRSFFKRLVLGIKYIFGYHCRYGHYNEWILEDEDAKELSELFASYAERLSKGRRIDT